MAAHLRRLMQSGGAGDLIRQHRAGIGRPHLLVRAGHHHPELIRHRQLHQVQRIERPDEHDATQQRGSDVVGVAA